jgi:AcrR family transcriptional regulator
MTEHMSLRERTRDRMRTEVADIGIRLFLERGFEAVNTAEIAAAADISPRSFFRYFPTKEDVVLSRLRDAGEAVAAALRSRPASESVWESLRIAFHALVNEPATGDDALELTRLVISTPSIQARTAQKRQDWETLLLPDILERLPPSGIDAAATNQQRGQALLAAGLAYVDTATRIWVATDGEADPVRLLDTLMAQLVLA